MLLKEDIQRIVKNIVEAKREAPAGSAAWGAKLKARTIKSVRSKQDADLVANVPNAEEKAKEKIKDILDSAHEKLSAIFAHEGTPHSIRQLDKDHRITSHLDRARKAFK